MCSEEKPTETETRKKSSQKKKKLLQKHSRFFYALVLNVPLNILYWKDLLILKETTKQNKRREAEAEEWEYLLNEKLN